MDIKKLVKSLIVRNLLYEIGLKDYNNSKNFTRRNRKPISYKITKPQVKTALELLKKNEQLTMNELAFDITPQHLGHALK